MLRLRSVRSLCMLILMLQRLNACLLFELLDIYVIITLVGFKVLEF